MGNGVETNCKSYAVANCDVRTDEFSNSTVWQLIATLRVEIMYVPDLWDHSRGRGEAPDVDVGEDFYHVAFSPSYIAQPCDTELDT